MEEYSRVFSLPHNTLTELKNNTVFPDNIYSQYLLYKQSIDALKVQFKFNPHVDYDNMYNNKFNNHLDEIIESSFPLRGLKGDYSRDFLSWWEVYNTTLRKHISDKFENRINKSGKRLPAKNATYRSFHINGLESSAVMEKFIPTVANYNWQFLATTRNLQKGRKEFITGAENGGEPTVGNMRKWANVASTTLKTVDLVTSSSSNYVIPALFALEVLEESGSAIIKIGQLVNTGQYSVLLLFSAAFEECKIVKTITDDVYLVGINMLNKPFTSRERKELTKYVSMEPNIATPISDLFSNYIPTHDAILDAINIIYDDRYSYYHGLFEIFENIRSADNSIKVGQTMAVDYWPTITKKWCQDTYFNYLE